MSILLQIAENILLLSFIGVAYFLIESRRRSLGDFKTDVLNGLGFGLTAALVTATPVILGDGASIDARAGPVILAGIVAGPVGGFLAAALGAATRGYVGGSFALSGMVVYLVYALLGIGLRHFSVVTASTLFSFRSIAVVAASSMAGACAMFFLISPTSRAIQWAQNDLPYILVANTFAVAYASLVIGVAIVFLRKSAELIRISETLNLARRTGRFGIWDYDIRKDELIWDRRSRELHGVESSLPVGAFDDWERNVHPDDLQKTKELFFEALSGQGNYDAEFRVRLPDGRQRSIKADATVVRDSAGNAVRAVGTNIDVTQIREADAKLAEARSLAFQAQRAETVAQLTGGVAHDFNNLLAVIVGSLGLLKNQLKTRSTDGENAGKLIDASLEAARRGSELTQNMLSYARKAPLVPERVNLNDIVRETEEWLRRTIESSVEIRTVLMPGLWATHMDKSSVQSALVNLMVNARDAVQGSGTITVETRNVFINSPNAYGDNERRPSGRYVTLVVSDDGIGMSDDMSARIFDPFFTTKPVGKGTGLGLSMVQGFVEQSRGTITVDSAPGEGTSFELIFPAVEGTIEPRTAREPDDSELPTTGREGGRILLVEDEAPVMYVLQQMLHASGYEVVTAASGDEAFELFQSDDHFDLVLTDIIMPGKLQGPMLASEIRNMRPDMRFIFLSGYASNQEGMSQGIGDDDLRLLKPVAQTDLIESIRKRLTATC